MTAHPPDDDSLERLANVGELAGLLVHEFTDFLNLLQINLATLSLRQPAAHHEDLAEVRQLCERVTGLVRRFHAYRRGQPTQPGAVDLHQVIEALATAFRDGAGALLRVEARAADPLVRGPNGDVRRLVRFLVGNALRASDGAAKPVRVATSSDGEHVRLVVEDWGPVVTEEELPYVFLPARDGRPGVDVLEMAACQSLAKRLGGTIRADCAAVAGLRVVVEFARVTDDV